MRQDNRWAKILVVGLLLTAFIISLLTIIPIAQGYGTSLSYGDGANMDALTQLTQAREGLYATLPDVFAQGGSAAVQISMALVAVILGLAVGSVIFAISFNLIMRGYVGVIQTKNSIDAGLLPTIRTISRNEPRLSSGSKQDGRSSYISRLIADSGSKESRPEYGVRKNGGNAGGADGTGSPIANSDVDIPTFRGIFSPGSEYDKDSDIE